MNDLTIIKNKLVKEKQELFKNYNIKFLAIFGSVSRGENTDVSDIDILVDFNKPIGIAFIDLADELENLLQSKIDLVSKNGIKPKYFEKIKTELEYV